jgi:uncharacterized SAM-binding protein YcdF (DUF218 family)
VSLQSVSGAMATGWSALSLPRPFESSVEMLLPNSVYLMLVLLAWAVVGLRRPMRAWGRGLTLALALWAYVMTTPGFTRGLVNALEQQHPAVALEGLAPGGDIVLLTSGSVERHGGRAVVRLDRPAWERTAAAAALWKRTQGRLIVVGGPVVDGLSPAKAMAEVAVTMGVPADRVSHDDQAKTTLDSFDRLGPQLAGPAQPWLVTSATHMQRALLAGQARGLNFRAFPCDFIATDAPGWKQWLPSTYAYRQNVVALHEWVGLGLYRLQLGP